MVNVFKIYFKAIMTFTFKEIKTKPESKSRSPSKKHYRFRYQVLHRPPRNPCRIAIFCLLIYAPAFFTLVRKKESNLIKNRYSAIISQQSSHRNQGFGNLATSEFLDVDHGSLENRYQRLRDGFRLSVIYRCFLAKQISF